jgi:conjugal transfer pilus assembly protein TraU
MTYREYLHAVTAAWLLCAPAMVTANEPATTNDPSCQDAKLLTGKLFTDICWSCMFPIRVAGASMGGDNAGVPPGASTESFCMCHDPKGVPHPGFVISMWEPARLVEVVRSPGCSMALGGLKLPLSDWRAQGPGRNEDRDSSDLSFYHYHYYSFPILQMLNLFVQAACTPDNYTDLDLMYMSEIDPTWNNDEIAFFINPEAAAVANPVAQAACAADAAAASVGFPRDTLWWCAGSWGGLYPLSGHALHTSMPTETSLLATRAVAALHRRGLSWRTKGDDVLCRGRIDPMLPKTQYRMSMFFPSAEAGDSFTYATQNPDGTSTSTSRKLAGSHPIGQTAFVWGEWRTIPAIGEDALYLLWRWNDCCSTF